MGLTSETSHPNKAPTLLQYMRPFHSFHPMIVVDEEHDASYKQEETPRYHGRDVAIVRAQAAGACVVLGSATPSLESRYNAEKGKYTLLELPGRIEARPMPADRKSVV